MNLFLTSVISQYSDIQEIFKLGFLVFGSNFVPRLLMLHSSRVLRFDKCLICTIILSLPEMPCMYSPQRSSFARAAINLLLLLTIIMLKLSALFDSGLRQ